MPEKERIISHIRLFIPKYRDEIPFKEVLEWADKVYKKACARSEKPIRLSDKEFWADKKDAARAYREGLKRAYETVDGIPAKKILEALPKDSAERARKITFDPWSSGGGGTVAAILAGFWLSGDQTALQSLREKDEVIIGVPILITEPKRAGQLRQQLKNLLLQLGGIISDANFSDEEFKPANEKIYKLVQEFAKDEFEVVVKLELVPESVTPADSREVLEIKYKINQFFYGEEQAQDLRRTSIEKKYHYPLNPDEYIGHPDKPAYFDMYLDIQISKHE